MPALSVFILGVAHSAVGDTEKLSNNVRRAPFAVFVCLHGKST